jgi:capsular exopolysaccharide synthesis family protein
MRPLDYLRIVRRRWWVLVLGTVIGFGLAFFTRPSESAQIIKTAPRIQYRSTNLLLADPSNTDRGVASLVGYDRLALLAIAGDVPREAMKKLHGSVFPPVVRDSGTDTSTDSAGETPSAASQRARSKVSDVGVPKVRLGKGSVTLYTPSGVVTVTAVPDPPTGALAITATGSRDMAPEAANAFADALVSYLDRLGVQQYDTKVAVLTEQRDEVYQQGVALDQQIAASASNPLLVASLQQRRSDIGRRTDELSGQLLSLTRSGPETSQLKTLERASRERVTLIVTPGGSAVSGSQRSAIGAAVGFIIALVILLLIEVLSSRIRDVPGTEGAARMPVIAEIPVVKMTKADRFYVATASDPSSLTAEAYRSLRTSLLAMWQRHPRNVREASVTNGNGHTNGNGNGNGHTNGNGNGNGHTNGNGGGRPLRTLLVTSPGPAEGKSISAVNLAAAFAETGMSVILLDADFRRPTLYRYLGRATTPNLGDLDLDCGPREVEAVLQQTDIPGVRLVASAPTKSDPGAAMAVAKAAATAAKELADIVILDSPPILLANDAADLALAVDATVLLARSGWTRRSGVVSSADLLRRLEATVIGIVIVGAEHGARAGYYGYYGYYGYGYGYAHPGEASITKRLLPWKGGHQQPERKRPTTSVPSAGEPGDVLPGSGSAATDPDEPWV